MNGKFRFSEQFRLKKSRDFETLYRLGHKIEGFFYALFFLPAEDIRLGISTPKRVGKAVIRNSEKRRVREAFRLIRPDFHGNFWIVVMVKRSEGLPFRKNAELHQMLSLLSEATWDSDASE